MATAHTQTLSITNYKTRSVTLYPASAAIVRDLTGIVVKSGVNEYIINNISASAQESSFRVEGHGTSATITDMSVELVSAPETSETSESSDESDSDTDPELTKLDDEIAELQLEREALTWTLDTSIQVLRTFEAYGGTLVSTPSSGFSSAKVPDTATIAEYVESYSQVRQEQGNHQKGIHAKLREMDAKIKKLEKQRVKLQKRRENPRKKKKETLEVYPYYRLRITVEAETLPADAPSVVAPVDTGKPPNLDDGAPPADAKGPSLRISYLVSNAGWSPKYELRFDTIARSGTLTFRAEAENCTDEKWSEAKVTLSTCHTKYSGASDGIPELKDWKVGLEKKELGRGDRDHYSLVEWTLLHPRPGFGPGVGLFCGSAAPSGGGFGGASSGGGFGSLPATTLGGLFGASTVPKNDSASSSSFGSATAPPRTTVPSTGGLFGSTTPAAAPPTGGFGSQPSAAPFRLFASQRATPTPSGFGTGIFGSSSAYSAAPPTGGLFGQPSAAQPGFGALSSGASGFGSQSTPGAPPQPVTGLFSSSTATNNPSAATLPYNPAAKMSHSTSVADTYGITTTYSLPGTKTLPSSGRNRLRFLVSETPLKNLELFYTVVPKLRKAAFLTAAVALPEDLPRFTVAGLLVDGTFVGKVQIPKKGADGLVRVSLGVDEALEVGYDKPGRSSVTRGLVRREELVTYTRAWEVKNRKNRGVRVVVRDQVPVVQVEEGKKLEMEVVKPREEGLLKEGGLVEWSFELEPGEMRREVLEWVLLIEKGEEAVVSLS